MPSTLVNEGGGIHVDGQGTVLVTETVQLDPGRNPGSTRDDVERELRRTLGVTQVVWLPRGLTRDYEPTSAPAGTSTSSPRCPRRAPSCCTGSGRPSTRTTACGRSCAPRSTRRGPCGSCRPRRCSRDDEGVVDWSYVNHLACNGGVVACTFDDPADAEALEVLRSAYPGREVVGVDARPLFARGGGIHCVTQQQPLTGAP